MVRWRGRGLAELSAIDPKIMKQVSYSSAVERGPNHGAIGQIPHVRIFVCSEMRRRGYERPGDMYAGTERTRIQGDHPHMKFLHKRSSGPALRLCRAGIFNPAIVYADITLPPASAQTHSFFLLTHSNPLPPPSPTVIATFLPA